MPYTQPSLGRCQFFFSCNNIKSWMLSDIIHTGVASAAILFIFLLHRSHIYSPQGLAAHLQQYRPTPMTGGCSNVYGDSSTLFSWHVRYCF
ncbi:hypothetical protein GDO78_007773 [Eleutherodactylus coqui]|uniref:Uncharacterized protein n=1 Tax=Eleutherodactylus coqui TaxID=57060 RepID=A0A8J6KDZ1_ELECQ|nr:hypothetical protein GDO78_007773 [Eleutherodactylus coqui]